MCRKSITCWGVVLKNNPLNFLTIAPTEDAAIEYVENLMRLTHAEDYRSWGYFNHIEDLSNPDVWHLYVQKRLSPQDFLNYAIVKCKFNPEGVSLALRVLNNCIPIGSSYDNPIEFENLKRLSTINGEIKTLVDNINATININPNISEDCAEVLIKNAEQ